MDDSAKQLIADRLRFTALQVENEGQELTDGEVIDFLAAAFGGYAEESEPGQKPDAAKAAAGDADFFRRLAEAVEPSAHEEGVGIESELRAIRLLLAEQAASRAEQHDELSRILKHGFEEVCETSKLLR